MKAGLTWTHLPTLLRIHEKLSRKCWEISHKGVADRHQGVLFYFIFVCVIWEPVGTSVRKKIRCPSQTLSSSNPGFLSSMLCDLGQVT